MTTANKITLTRIAMIPFFIYFAAQPMRIIDELRYLVVFPTSTVIALVLFCVASFTDFLDGYVARKYNQVTDFGKFVDPLADKLLVASALILFVEQKAMAGWMVCVILARELESGPKLLVMAHPTRGLDIGATSFVHEQMIAARERGVGILLISADFDEILEMSDGAHIGAAPLGGE